MIDYHVHLWTHDEPAALDGLRLERLAAYCELANTRGVREIALTEHLFRFTQVREIAQAFWDAESDERLKRQMDDYFAFHATADLDVYVESVLAAKNAGLPVVLGLEVDYYRGSMDRVARLLDGYPFDVLLGSVHWLGTWMFDNLSDEVSMGEWDRRGVDSAWSLYTEAVEELASTKTCDVLAHPDLIKVTGRRPSNDRVEEYHARIASAARHSEMAAEISSAGLRKPVGEEYPAKDLLRRFFEEQVPVTTASDAHAPIDVADQHHVLVERARAAGYDRLCAFDGRRRRVVALEEGIEVS